MKNLPTYLYYLGRGGRFDRPLYFAEGGQFYTNIGPDERPEYCTVYYTENPWYGEPSTPMPKDWHPVIIDKSNE